MSSQDEEPKFIYHFDSQNKRDILHDWRFRRIGKEKNIDSFSKPQFQKARNGSSFKKLFKLLDEIAFRINDVELESLPESSFHKTCLIICNTYGENEKTGLGIGPMSDAYMLALHHHNQGYKVFYLYDPTKAAFLEAISFFLQKVRKALTIFYAGRGQVFKNKQQNTKTNAFVFIDSNIDEHELTAKMAENINQNCKVVLIADCCHSSAAWNIKSDNKNNSNPFQNVISISAAKCSDSEISTGVQGLLSFYLATLLKQSPSIKPKELVEQIDPYLKRFNEHVIVEYSMPEMDSKPIFLK